MTVAVGFPPISGQNESNFCVLFYYWSLEMRVVLLHVIMVQAARVVRPVDESPSRRGVLPPTHGPRSSRGAQPSYWIDTWQPRSSHVQPRGPEAVSHK